MDNGTLFSFHESRGILLPGHVCCLQSQKKSRNFKMLKEAFCPLEGLESLANLPRAWLTPTP